MRLLLVEDDEILGRSEAQALGAAGHQVDWVRRGGEALVSARAAEFDAILLDLGLPDQPGEAVIREMRAARIVTPVIVMTARGQTEDRVTLLDMGADDYLVKPVDLKELVARVKAIRRRTEPGDDATEVQRVGPLELVRASRLVRWQGEPVLLTTRQYDVLETLVMRRTRVVSRAQLEDALYGLDEGVESNAVEVYVHMLRRRFTPALIKTVRGKGYSLGSAEAVEAELERRTSRSAT